MLSFLVLIRGILLFRDAPLLGLIDGSKTSPTFVERVGSMISDISFSSILIDGVILSFVPIDSSSFLLRRDLGK